MWTREEQCLALVDGNNFFVSCERVFNPRLHNRPVIVLSPNDGCIVSRSNEAKAMGIPMGAPFFEHRHTLERSGGVALSSNFELYGDMSSRMMNCLRELAPGMEVYSIDEAFLDLTGVAPAEVEPLAQQMRERVLKWTGLPISVGVAPSKVLAKAANRTAKKDPQLMKKGVCIRMNAAEREEMLGHMQVEDLWGISTRLGRQLRALGVRTALQLKNADPARMKSAIGVMMEQMVRELNGVSCNELHTSVEARKNILSSRSFATAQTDLEVIAEALASHVDRIARKLREQKSLAGGVQVYLTSQDAQREWSGASAGFAEPLQDTRLILKKARELLEEAYRPGKVYKKVGAMLWAIVPQGQMQPLLWTPEASESPRSQTLMQVFDKIQKSEGHKSLFWAAQGTQKSWHERKNRRSPRYTTCWDELLQVR